MKQLSRNFSNYLLYFIFTFIAVGLMGCSNDDDVDPIIPPNNPTGTITAEDQTISQNTVTVQTVIVGQDSWLVARNAGEESDPGIVSEAVLLEAGTHQNVELPLTDEANLGGEEGDEITLMLHVDDANRGTPGTFDYDGQSGVDSPITNAAGQNVQETITVTGPSLSAEDDQMVTENNEVTFSSVNTPRNGWIILYGQNEAGEIDEDQIIGRRYVEAGTQTDYTVPFDEGYQYTPGSTIFPRLYLDDPEDQEFTYTPGGTEDLPESFGYDPTTGEARFVGNTSTTGGFTVQ